MRLCALAAAARGPYHNDTKVDFPSRQRVVIQQLMYYGIAEKGQTRANLTKKSSSPRRRNRHGNLRALPELHQLLNGDSSRGIKPTLFGYVYAVKTSLGFAGEIMHSAMTLR